MLATGLDLQANLTAVGTSNRREGLKGVRSNGVPIRARLKNLAKSTKLFDYLFKLFVYYDSGRGAHKTYGPDHPC